MTKISNKRVSGWPGDIIHKYHGVKNILYFLKETASQRPELGLDSHLHSSVDFSNDVWQIVGCLDDEVSPAL